MKTNVSRKTINTYIYLKKNHVINNKSVDKQVHMMKASNNKNLFQKLLWFLNNFWFTKMKGPEMVKWESLRINMFQITATQTNQKIFPYWILIIFAIVHHLALLLLTTSKRHAHVRTKLDLQIISLIVKYSFIELLHCLILCWWHSRPSWLDIRSFRIITNNLF